jgi:hypothetical protein
MTFLMKTDKQPLFSSTFPTQRNSFLSNFGLLEKLIMDEEHPGDATYSHWDSQVLGYNSLHLPCIYNWLLLGIAWSRQILTSANNPILATVAIQPGQTTNAHFLVRVSRITDLRHSRQSINILFCPSSSRL